MNELLAITSQQKYALHSYWNDRSDFEFGAPRAGIDDEDSDCGGVICEV